MLEHYVIQALRSFWRFRVTAGVNLLGLVLAVVCFIATYLYLDALLRSDSHFPKAARTYLVTQELWTSPTVRMIPAFPQAGPPAAKYLRADFPALEAVARALALGGIPAASDDRKANLFVAAVDPDFLKIFDFEFKEGRPAGALEAPHGAIITERTAERMFGTPQALGRRLLLWNQLEVTVTGVIAAVPRASHMDDSSEDGLRLDIIVPMDLIKEVKIDGVGFSPFDADSENWGNDSYFTYALLPADGSLTASDFIQQLGSFAARHEPQGAGYYSVFGAVPLSHLWMATIDAFMGSNVFSLASSIFTLDVLILAIACLNYANLAVAIATTRAKEIGVRKVLGATRLHLMRQYIVEAVLLAIAAVIIVIALAAIAIEPVNRMFEANLQMSALLKPRLWGLVAGLIAAISLIGGAYPALVLSRVRPVEALRAGAVRAGPRFVPIVLVGVQFSAASFLLVVALLVTYQNDMLQRKALNTGRDPVVVFGNNLGTVHVSFDALRSELLRNPNIKAVTTVTAPPWSSGGDHYPLSRGIEKSSLSNTTLFNRVGYDFFETMGLKMLAGRALDREHGDVLTTFGRPPPAGKPVPIVIDRSLAAALGWRDPNEAVNQNVYGPVNPGQPGNAMTTFRVIGVVEDGYPRLVGPNTDSNAYALSPVFAAMPLVRISRENIPATLSYIDETWNHLAPKVALQRDFMDVFFRLAYQKYAAVSGVLRGLAVFAFFISVMGLCGLAVHVTSRRRREIGIRKTLGASARGVVLMLLFDFAKPVLIANLIAWPFAYLIGRAYLNQFVERTELTPWPFALSLLVTVGVAWAAVAVQALRAASVKPANVLYAQ